MAASEMNEIISVLVSDFEKWNEGNDSTTVYLIEAAEQEDGSSVLSFNIGGDYDFKLICPAAYPSPDCYFLVESSPHLSVWCNMLNEFILDSPTTLKIRDILFKAVDLYKEEDLPTDVNIFSEEESMEEGSEASLEEFELDESEDLEIQLKQKKERWLKKEAERREVAEQTGIRRHPVSPRAFRLSRLRCEDNKQIFSGLASSGILINELISIMRNEKKLGITADAINDDIYHWNVRFYNFEPNSELADDLNKLKAEFGYNYIELELTFAVDLYPFYPPLVKFLRPRLQAGLHLTIASMNHLKLSSWNPANSMQNILLSIKDVLQDCARLKIDSRLNDKTYFPEGSYLEIENLLDSLTMVSEVAPRAKKYFQFPQGGKKKRKRPKKKNKRRLSKVIGYGTRYSPQWNVHSFAAARKAKDKMVSLTLKKILNELRTRREVPLLLPRGNKSTKDLSISSDLEAMSSLSPPIYTTDIEEKNENAMDCCQSFTNSIQLTEKEEHLYEILEYSSLIPFLEIRLQEDAFLLELSKHFTICRSVLDILNEIAARLDLIPLLGPLPHQKMSLQQLLKNIEDNASIALRSCAIQQTRPNESEATLAKKKENQLIREFFQFSKTLSSLLEIYGAKKLVANSQEPVSAEEPEVLLYQKVLRDLQFQVFELPLIGQFAHSYAQHYSANQVPPDVVFRVVQELSSLSTSLPLDMSSSIFLLSDENKCTLLRAMITGPEGTPYSGGCFIFDIYLPNKYPSSPPLVRNLTTGGNTVKFNPNLYPCGKVCLSLLGTGESSVGETWNENLTVLQVLFSIQSLILVSDPYFNEPGYESLIGTDSDEQRSSIYNQNIKANVIKWAMLNQLNNPYPGFEEITLLHFYLRKDRILREVDQWVKENPLGLQKLSEILKTELNNLKLTDKCKELLDNHHPGND